MSSHVTKCMKKKGRMNIAFAAIPIIKRKGKRTEEEASFIPWSTRTLLPLEILLDSKHCPD